MKINCSYKELIALDDPRIIPHPKNPNVHPDKQIERLAKIIEYQGQRSPIVISTRSGFITKGHGRLAAIKKLGWENIAVDFQDYENDAMEWSDIVADNAIAEWATLDKDLIIGELETLDLDIELLGIEDFDMQKVGEVDMPELPSGDKQPFQQKTFTLHDEQVDTVDEAIEKVKTKYKEAYSNEVNENSNGNAIAYICELFISEC